MISDDAVYAERPGMWNDSREVMSLSWTFLVVGAVEHSGAVTHQALLIMAWVSGGKAGWRIEIWES